MVLLPGSRADAATQICSRIMHHVASMPKHPQLEKDPTISLGFTEFHMADSPETIVARADRALYRAKREGRNCVREDAIFVRPARRSESAQLPAAYKPLPARISQLGRRDPKPGRLGA